MIQININLYYTYYFKKLHNDREISEEISSILLRKILSLSSQFFDFEYVRWIRFIYDQWNPQSITLYVTSCFELDTSAEKN